jgi:hypothetical protein
MEHKNKYETYKKTFFKTYRYLSLLFKSTSKCCAFCGISGVFCWRARYMVLRIEQNWPGARPGNLRTSNYKIKQNGERPIFFYLLRADMYIPCRDVFVLAACRRHHSVNWYFVISDRSLSWLWWPLAVKTPCSLFVRFARHLLAV